MERRRRERVSIAIAVLVTSLDPHVTCKERGMTIDVSSNGALVRISHPIPFDTRVRLDIANSNRVAGGRVVGCDRDGQGHWRVRVQLLQQTGNFWGLKCPPKDWEDRGSLDIQEWYR